MATVYIIGTFAFMLAMVGCILGTCYSLARGLWFSAFMGALAAIISFTFLLDAMDGVERAYVQTIAQSGIYQS